MKQLFRCEYCDKTGTAEQIAEHEKECMYNYHKRSCWACKHAEWKMCEKKITNERRIKHE